VVFKLSGSQPVFCLILDRFGRWTCPKGHVEPGESPVQAALREVREEVGLSDPEVASKLGERRYRFSSRRKLVSKKVHWFLMRAAPGARLSPDRKEKILDAQWLPAQEAVLLCGYRGMRSILRLAAERAGALCRDAEVP
jgi:8-oxo-dGTP pyrophosphatase MutT (NUDIX family)